MISSAVPFGSILPEQEEHTGFSDHQASQQGSMREGMGLKGLLGRVE